MKAPRKHSGNSPLAVAVRPYTGKMMLTGCALLSLASAPAHSQDSYPLTWYVQDTWITDVGTLLYGDEDNDGYYTGLSLSLDADTRYTDIDVYTTIDLQRIPGTRERLHTSGLFTLSGDSLNDEYRIDIDLLRNYPIGSYDLYIDLYDAHDHRMLDGIDASHFSNLAALPLESEDFDSIAYLGSHPDIHPVREPPVRSDDIRVQEYAGSAGWITTLILAGILCVRLGTAAASCRTPLTWRKLCQSQSERSRGRAFILSGPLRSAASFCVLEDSHRDGRLPSTTPALTG
jgi:hypothetical protein